MNEEGTAVEDELGLKELGCKHFAQIFCDDNQTDLLAQLKVAILYPIMISPMDAPCLTKPVTIAEIESALHSFKKDRSPGPDGWPAEFYIHFFGLLGKDLLAAIEHTRVSGCVPPSLNSTFLAMIPKKDKPITFADFRPISLCNLLYKLISKVIVVHLKPHLDTHISRE